jgi:hypothetical protein
MLIQVRESIKAKIINNDECPDLYEGNLYEVERISIGQSSTSVELRGCKHHINFLYNMKFYHNEQEIDIFKSRAFNPYLGNKGPIICYGEMKKPETHKGLPF